MIRTRELRSTPAWVVAALLGGVALVTALAATTPVPDSRHAATLWPAAAFALAALALTPPRRWAAVVPGIALVVAAGDVLARGPVAIALGHGGLEALGALAAALVLTARGRRTPALEQIEDFLRLLGAGAVYGAVVAAAVLLTARPHGVAPSLAAATAAVSHLTAVLVLAPLALVGGARRRASRVEGVVQTGLLVLTCALSLLPSGQASVLTFAPVLFLAWAGLRFDLQVAIGELVLFASFVTTLSVTGHGPFALRPGQTDPDSLMRLGDAQALAYLSCIAILVLPLAITAQHNTHLLEQMAADGRLFRRNFTDSLVGMAFLQPAPDGADLVVTDLNDTALDILRGHGPDLVGRRLRELVQVGPEYDGVLRRLLAGDLDGWRSECALTGARSGRVTLQLSRLTGHDDPGEAGDRVTVGIQLLDVTTEYEARRDLEMAQQLTATTLDTAACIILVVDLDGVIVRVNAATVAITGWAESQLLGRPVAQTGVAATDPADVEALMTWPDRTGVPVVRETDVLTRSGETLRVVWNANVVRGDDGRPAFAVLTGIDVTAERTTRGLVNHLMEASFTTALVGVDTLGRISVVNSGLEHLLGYDRDELVGQPFHRLIKTSELLERTGAGSLTGAFATLVRGLGVDGETRPRDWTWVTNSGADRVVSMSLSIAQDALAAQGGYLCVARDVTETRHSQEMLIAALDTERTAVERLRSLDQAKNHFVSTVSHELRTPVTSIIGYAELMADGSVVDPLPDQVPLLETINRNGQRLIATINDLLLLGGLDSGTVHSRLEPVDLVDLVGPVAEAVRPLLTGRDLVLDVDRPASRIVVQGDPAQLDRVLTNLVSNAVKFTEDGGRVAVTVTVQADQAVLTVSDTGIGIPEEEQRELFQRFFRSSTAQTRQIQGTGLGLSIVAEIVASHGGTIEVTSAHLRGSTFTVRLPLAHADQLTPVG